MDHKHSTRELNDEAIRHLVARVRAYLAKPGNRGASFLLDTLDLLPADRRAVLAGLSEAEP